MDPGADVNSLEALGDWYAALAQFRTEGQNALTSVALALQHAADWVAQQQQHWRHEVRRAEDAIVEARNALRTKQYQDWSGQRPDTTVEEKNLKRALARLDFVEQQVEVTRRWMQKLPTVIEDTYTGPARNLSFFLDVELTRALAVLSQQLGALEQYVQQAAPEGKPS